MAGPGPAHVLKREPERSADHGVGARPLPEGIARGIDAEALRDGPVHDDERRARVRRRLHGLEVKGRVRHRFDGGEDDRQVLGKRACHDRIGRYGLDARPPEPRHEDRDHFVGFPPCAPEHRRDARSRGRDGGKTVAPAALHQPGLEAVEIVGRVDLDCECACPVCDRGGVGCERAQHVVQNRLGLGGRDGDGDAAQGMRHSDHREAG